MHETALLQNLLSAAEEALAPYEVEKVERLTVKAGVPFQKVRNNHIILLSSK